MEAKELRIGNWVNCQKRNMRVETIDETGINCEISGGYYVGDTEKDYSGYFKDEWFANALVSPIQLTPDLLIKNGFTEDNSVHLWLNLQTHYLELITAMDGYYPVYVQIPEMNSEIQPYFPLRVSLARINYVHQLQNLIYTLTGTELTIKF